MKEHLPVVIVVKAGRSIEKILIQNILSNEKSVTLRNEYCPVVNVVKEGSSIVKQSI